MLETVSNRMVCIGFLFDELGTPMPSGVNKQHRLPLQWRGYPLILRLGAILEQPLNTLRVCQKICVGLGAVHQMERLEAD